MNYYKRHIGDYAAATRHLSMIEHGAYTLLLDIYYTGEKALPGDEKAVQRLVGARTKEEREAVSQVLGEFFDLRDGEWCQSRCDEEIAKKQEKTDINRAVGRLGGRPKKETQTVSENNPDGFCESTQTLSENNPSHKPVTNNQEPVVTEERRSRPRAAAPRRRLDVHALPEEWAAYCRQKVTDQAPESIFDRFHDYHLAKGEPMADWFAAWRTWVTRQATFTRPQQAPANHLRLTPNQQMQQYVVGAATNRSSQPRKETVDVDATEIFPSRIAR